MSRVCAICGKKPGFGHNRSHSMVATKRRFDPNLQRVRILLKGKPTRAYVCTRWLEMLLGMRPDVEVVAAIENGNDVVQLCRDHHPDVVVMDYRLPGLDGVQATAVLRRECPDVAVVCLTASASVLEMEALTEAGAAACLTKDEELDDIVAAIRDAARR
jgi:large subunit ribosomal protein L28